MNPAKSKYKKLLYCVCWTLLTIMLTTGCTTTSTTVYVYNTFASTAANAVYTGIEFVTTSNDESEDTSTDDKTTGASELTIVDTKPSAPKNENVEDKTSPTEEKTTPTTQNTAETPPANVYNLTCRYHGESQAEVDAGGIIEYYPNYYASHYYDEGAIFYNFEPGTVVNIDGKSVVIDGAYYGDYNIDYIEDTKNKFGWDSVYFQTCLGEGSEIVIYYGHQQ